MDENDVRMKNLKLFKANDELTDEERIEQRRIQSLGGKACSEKKRMKKSLQETAKDFLELTIDREYARKMLGDTEKLLGDDNLTIQAIVTALALNIAQEDGNVKALEFLRDTSGQKPKDVQEIKADIMTESDKRLLKNVAKRVNVSTDDGQNADQ